MEISLQELMEQIRKNGVEAAQTEADAIREKAKAEAAQIIADAKREAENILSAAKEENDRLVKVSEDTIRQAGRNMLLSFRESAARELRAVAGEEIARVYTPEVLTTLIPQVVEAWSKNARTEDLAVLLPREELDRLEEVLYAVLKERMLTGVVLKPDDSFDDGFRITGKNGSAYYDYSAAAVTEMVSAYLNPRITALMKEANA